MTTPDDRPDVAPFRPAERTLTSVLASSERRCLIAIAGRLPLWINSDHLTALALIAMALGGAAFGLARFNRSWLWAVVACLGLNWFGDSLDGTLARVRSRQRPRYGFYLDHIVDAFGVLFLLAGLGASGFMSPFMAMGVLVAYFLLSIEIYLATYCVGVFRLSFWSIGPTELRILLATGALALMNDPRVPVLGGRFRLFDVGGVVAIVGIAMALLTSAVRNTRALYRSEPLPPVAPPPIREKGETRRWLVFNVVGGMGVVVQLTCLALLTRLAGVGDVTATAIAVEAAILHNFLWRGSWTWSDRPASWRGALGRLVRFNLTNGLLSLTGNLVVTVGLVRLTGMQPLPANGIAIGLCSVANFLISRRLVFAQAVCLVVVMAVPAAGARAADLLPADAAAFERAARLTEARLDEEREGRLPFLRLDRLPAGGPRGARASSTSGEIVVHRMEASGDPDRFVASMCHHWMGTMLIAGARLDQVVALMQAYDRYAELYRPSVRRSRLISRDGGQFNVSLRLFMSRVVSVVLDTESNVSYFRIDPTRAQVRSRSTRIAEILDPDTPREREAPQGHDNGFLWRFNNYCALEERREGTYVQCESLSLTRDIPFGLGWMIGPLVTSIPRESLQFTMRSLRVALATDLPN